MLVSALLSGALTSCSDSFLDLKDPNHFTNENFWKDKADAESALAAAYSPIKYQMNGYYGAFDGWLNLNSRGDDIFTILNEEASMWDIATFQNSATTGNDPYGALYTGIQRANIVLRYIDNVPASGITESDRATIKGEALTLRAYQYFLLVNNYGNVPLQLVPSNEDDSDKRNLLHPKSGHRLKTTCLLPSKTEICLRVALQNKRTYRERCSYHHTWKSICNAAQVCRSQNAAERSD